MPDQVDMALYLQPLFAEHGLNPNLVKEVLFEPTQVTITVYAVDLLGAKYVRSEDGEVAVDKIVLPGTFIPRTPEGEGNAPADD